MLHQYMPRFQPLHHYEHILFDTAQLQQIMESTDYIWGNDEITRKNLFETHGIVHTKEWRPF
jgi:hypothetical protein